MSDQHQQQEDTMDDDNQYKTGDDVILTISGVSQRATVEHEEPSCVYVIWLGHHGQLQRLRLEPDLAAAALSRATTDTPALIDALAVAGILCVVTEWDADEASTNVYFGGQHIGEASWGWGVESDEWSWLGDGWTRLERWLHDNQDLATPDDVRAAACAAIAEYERLHGGE